MQLLGLLLLGLFLPCTSRPQPKHQIRTPEEWKQEKERRDRTLEVEFVLLLPLGEIVLLGHLQFLPSPPTRQEKRGQRRQSRRSDQTLANKLSPASPYVPVDRRCWAWIRIVRKRAGPWAYKRWRSRGPAITRGPSVSWRMKAHRSYAEHHNCSGSGDAADIHVGESCRRVAHGR